MGINSINWWKEPQPTPIADTLREAALLLDMKEAPRDQSGFLFQAQIIRELAKRTAGLSVAGADQRAASDSD